MGTDHGLTGWSTLDLAMLGVMLVAISSIVSSLVARFCAVFVSFSCWGGVSPLLQGWRTACCQKKKSAGFSRTYENFYFLSMFSAGFLAPPFVAVLFSEQPRPYGIPGVGVGWDGDYYYAEYISGGGLSPGVDLVNTGLTISLSFWAAFLFWFACVRKLLLQGAWFHFVESALVLSCSVFVVVVTLIRTLPVAAE